MPICQARNGTPKHVTEQVEAMYLYPAHAVYAGSHNGECACCVQRPEMTFQSLSNTPAHLQSAAPLPQLSAGDRPAAPPCRHAQTARSTAQHSTETVRKRSEHCLHMHGVASHEQQAGGGCAVGVFCLEGVCAYWDTRLAPQIGRLIIPMGAAGCTS